MMKFITFVIGCLSLFISGIGQAEVVQLNKLYLGGSEIELPGSGVTFTVPSGWRGKFNQTTRNFDMGIGNQNLQLVVRYRGSSYASVLADFQQGLPLVNGDSLKPNGMHETMQGKFHGEVFGYAGVINFMQLNAVGLVIKNPSGRAVEIKSLGIDQPFPRLSGHIGLIIKTLRFPAYEQEFSAKASQQTSRPTHLSSQANRRYQIQGRTVAGVRILGEIYEDMVGPPSWVQVSKGWVFKGYGNRKLPKFVDHKREGLFLFLKAEKTKKTYLSRHIYSNVWENSAGTKQLLFQVESAKNSYRGVFIVSSRMVGGNSWRQVDTGRYQIFTTTDNEYAFSLETMFLDRKNGKDDVVVVELVEKEDSDKWYWSNVIAFNGEVYKSHGINTSGSYKWWEAADVKISKCMGSGGGAVCRYKAFPETYDSAGHYIEKGSSSSSSSSSSGSYDTHFGTTDSGAIIFSSPSGSMCSGC